MPGKESKCYIVEKCYWQGFFAFKLKKPCTSALAKDTENVVKRNAERADETSGENSFAHCKNRKRSVWSYFEETKLFILNKLTDANNFFPIKVLPIWK